MKYKLYVGNIGLVSEGNNKAEILKDFSEYVRQSREGSGRAAQEEVILFEDDEIIREYIPQRS